MARCSLCESGAHCGGMRAICDCPVCPRSVASPARPKAKTSAKTSKKVSKPRKAASPKVDDEADPLMSRPPAPHIPPVMEDAVADALMAGGHPRWVMLKTNLNMNQVMGIARRHEIEVVDGLE